ncbi:glycosyltransferase family 4 protein [Radiobacillus kanasensis]|uniref:glycosyltransferase family 4 protein n=1 Tax=Radiobacillus kanasensis TaxID=2844358 RepID=UPI001E3A6D8E|nr:glycosyltransferase family 4 protein [Radiobacillus kanasensis]UFT98855.1 glycosyltransferase family 4 protein [Radiobacillus kanasensis]
MKKICMVAYTHYLSDPRVRREAEALVERGDEVDVICLKDKEGIAEVNGVNTIGLNVKRYRGEGLVSYFLSYLHFFFRALLVLTLLYRKKRYHCIYVHTLPNFMVFTAIIPKLLGAKVILDMHDLMTDLFATKFNGKGLKLSLLYLEEKISMSFSDHIITVHDPYKAILISRGIKPEKVTVIMNVPDTKLFPSPTVQLLDDNKEKFKIVYHGSVVERYGIDLVVRSLSSIREELGDVRFYIYGNGDYVTKLQELIKELRVHDLVLCEGKRYPVDKIHKLISDADLAIVPNRLDGFTKHILPTKLVEYVALGIPIISSKLPTLSSYFSDEMIMYFEPGNLADLTSKIKLVVNGNIDTRKYAVNAKSFLVDYNWEIMKQKQYAVIDKLT